MMISAHITYKMYLFGKQSSFY